MDKELLKKYPLVKRYFMELDMIGLTPPADVRKWQETAIGLLDAHGQGTPEEKEASMVGAALMLYPTSLYSGMERYFEPNYPREVEQFIQGMMAITPDGFMQPTLAQASAACGIAVLEDIAGRLKAGKPLPGAPAEVLEGLRGAYGRDMIVFALLDEPKLTERFEAARDAAFTGLEQRIRGEKPPMPKKPFRPGGGDFDL